ncbi:MAG: hypothetical protein KC421_16595, partial [Anaerolineales bacterium]|nr:hypothetical protein [Anaerolineales bacterium]
STIAGNHTDGDGGGLKTSNDDTAVSINNSLISGNTAKGQGGGIANDGGSISVSHTTVKDNTALLGGGGIYNYTAGTAVIHNTTINNNEAGAGFFNGNKFGGGIKNVGSGSYVEIVNSTISGNVAADDGAGLYNNTSTIDLLHVTIVDNHALSEAGGIDNFGTVNVENSIVAGNTAVSSPADCRSLYGWPLISNGHNLFGSGTGCPVSSTDLTVAPTDIFTTVLAPLSDNGGPTQTHALIAGSPAID